jgi:hypothetical protein
MKEISDYSHLARKGTVFFNMKLLKKASRKWTCISPLVEVVDNEMAIKQWLALLFGFMPASTVTAARWTQIHGAKTASNTNCAHTRGKITNKEERVTPTGNNKSKRKTRLSARLDI